MRVFMPRVPARAMTLLLTLFASLVLAGSTLGQTQANAADLRGTVTDPSGAVVAGATVTARNSATGTSRTVTAGSDGEYQFIALQPGEYEISAEAATFKKVIVSGVRLTVGQAAELTMKLELGSATAVVNISADDVAIVETTRSTVSNTIDQQRIQNLPINERSATGFALTLSTVGRDNGRPIGPAPTSGLNIGGQRGRSTQVNVDGADFTDNSINAARTTVSMEAVQEYQVATNSYTPEFGRATGGVINVVTKRGTNDVHGNVFGFIRDKRIQARNAFAPIAKPDFRRTQFGGTIGGPLVKDQMFVFASFERRQRDESGFFTSDVVGPLTQSVTIPVIANFNPIARTFTGLTAAQAAGVSQLVAAGGTAVCAARAYAYFASSGTQNALTGNNTLTSPNDGSLCPAISPILGPTTPIGSRFFLTGAPVPISANAFRPLNGLQRVFPVTERANYSSVRFDQNINPSNLFSIRMGYNTSNLSGIQVESQNQSIGQNDFTRTGITNIIDTSVNTELVSILSSRATNDLRFSFGRRRTNFHSQNGDAVAYNIFGTAFVGSELFAPVDRTENRYQYLDNLTFVAGNHTFKFGGDANFIAIPNAHFELDYSGLFNFGNTQVANFGLPATLPDLTPVQSYGLGLPSTWLQGFGVADSRITNKAFSVFGQDSWKIRRLTLNYGIRYDVESPIVATPVPFTDTLSGIPLTAQDFITAQNAVNVQQGIPRDKNNWQPRIGFAYDMFGNAKTVLRGSIGIYYDHPLLAIAFNSDIVDEAQQQQAVGTAGSPITTSLFNASQIFQGTVVPCNFPGANPTTNCTPGVAPSAQYLAGRQKFNNQTFTGFGSVLPFSLPISKDFEYASATQANFGVEQQIGKNMSIAATYIFVGAHHLPHPNDLNPVNSALLIQNYIRCFGTAPTSTQAASTVSPTTCAIPGHTFANVIPGMISVDLNTGQRVIAPAVANFFRPNAPNYFLASALSQGAVSKAVLDSQLTGTLRTPGALTPFGATNGHISNGNSTYNAMNIDFKRRYANNFTFLASYTWSHSIDDSSDLQTLLMPQDSRNFAAEKGDSLFDQRHRFVFSGAWMAPDSWRTGDGWQRAFNSFTIAPIFEWSSGRPFNILSNVDTNSDQTAQTDRPSVNADGSLCVPGPAGCSTGLITNGQFSTGNLGRNSGITHSYQSLDLRVSRAVRFGEHAKLDLIAEGFNLFNRFNEASASPFITDVNAFHQRAGNGRYYSRPTAAYDSRQFQFGAKLSW
jgi:hypothetical protein